LVTLDVVPVDDVVSEGESSTVDVTLANKTCDPLTDASLTLRAPAGWTVQPASADVGDVEAQGQTTATFIVQAPDDAASDDPIATAELTAHASYDARGTVPDSAAATGALSVAQTVQPPFRTFRSTEAYWGQAGDRFAIYAGGRDMSGSVDQYGTIYRDAAAPPDARAEVTVTSQGDTGPWAKAGLVMRNDATGRSAGYVVVAVTPDNGFVLQWDADGNGYLDGGRSTLKAGSTQYPVRLRLERHGTAYTGSYRLESQDWQSIGTVTVPGGSPAQDVGMVASAVNALNPDTISQVEYDHFTLDP